MLKIAAAMAAFSTSVAIAISAPANATDYVETVNTSSFSYSAETFWNVQPSGFEAPYTGVGEISGSFALGSMILNPGDTLTVDVNFSSSIPFGLGGECCLNYVYQRIWVFGPDYIPLGLVVRPWNSGVILTNSGGDITGVTAYFVAATYDGDYSLHGVQLEGDYGFDFIAGPEPSGWSLVILGVGLVGTTLRYRRRTLSA